MESRSICRRTFVAVFIALLLGLGNHHASLSRCCCFVLLYSISAGGDDDNEPSKTEEAAMAICSPSTTPWTEAPLDDDDMDLRKNNSFLHDNVD